MRYFKPKNNLEYSCMLLPQKTDGKRQWRYDNRSQFPQHHEWVENYSVNMELLANNFIEVATEAEALA